MAYLGLVPGEDSSGDKHRRGRITRTGNALVRRLLVETAWHYQHRPSVGVALTRRRKGQPRRVIAIEALGRRDKTATPAGKASSNRTVGLIEYRIRQDLILFGSFGRDFKEITGTKPLVSFLGLNLGFGDKPMVTATTKKAAAGQK